jgi:hypothetical protein
MRKNIDLDHRTKMILELDAVRNGTNLKAYIEKMCDDRAKELQKENLKWQS